MKALGSTRRWSPRTVCARTWRNGKRTALGVGTLEIAARFGESATYGGERRRDRPTRAGHGGAQARLIPLSSLTEQKREPFGSKATPHTWCDELIVYYIIIYYFYSDRMQRPTPSMMNYSYMLFIL